MNGEKKVIKSDRKQEGEKMTWENIIKNDMEEHEIDMLRDEQRGSNEKVPKKEIDDMERAIEAISEILRNKTIMGLDDTGDLEVSLQRTRASLGHIIRDYEKSPYLDIKD